MDLFDNMALGFSVALRPEYLLYGMIGALLGTAVGIMPGLSKGTAIALLLPVTYQMDDVIGAFIMFGGIFYGAGYGGSSAAILANAPGEADSVITAIDGHQMVRRGRAGAALTTAAVGSFVAGTVGTFVLMTLAQPIVHVALLFGPVEYLAVMLMGFALIVSLGGAPIRAGFATCLGMVLGTIGIDTQTGDTRFTGGDPNLYNGIDFLVAALGLFAVSEVLIALGQIRKNPDERPSIVGKLGMTKDERRRSIPAWGRGTLVGLVTGILPGAGSTIASFTAYSVEKMFAKPAVPFGKGAIEGVAGPEAANNSAASGALVPLLFLGIPASAATAIMLAGLRGHGVSTGPLLLEHEPELVWGLIASLYIANVLLLILNLPLVRLWVKLIDVPRSLLYPIILAVSIVGVYSLSGNIFDVYLMFVFGILGVILRRLDVPLAPLVLALILSPLVEREFRRALEGAQGDWSVLISSPAANVIYLVAVVVALTPPFLQRKAGMAANKAKEQSRN